GRSVSRPSARSFRSSDEAARPSVTAGDFRLRRASWGADTSSDAEMGQRPPHLLTRFAATSLVAFVAVGVIVSFVIAEQSDRQAQGSAKDHARFVASSVIKPALVPSSV